MNPQASREYLKAKVLTATPEQLHLMLFDGAVKFCERARLALDQKQFEVSFNLLSRAQKILLELNCGLKHDVSPGLCKNLSSLYLFCYRRLVEANTAHDLAALDEAIEILRYQRETWVLLMQQLQKSKANAAARTLAPGIPAPDERMESRLRLSA
jgi:flagellar protein FliS